MGTHNGRGCEVWYGYRGWVEAEGRDCDRCVENSGEDRMKKSDEGKR